MNRRMGYAGPGTPAAYSQYGCKQRWALCDDARRSNRFGDRACPLAWPAICPRAGGTWRAKKTSTGTDRNAAGAVLCPQARLVTGCCGPRCLSGDGFQGDRCGRGDRACPLVRPAICPRADGIWRAKTSPTGTDRSAKGAALCPQARLVTGRCNPRCLSGTGFGATGVVMGTELVRWRGLRSVPERVVFGAQKKSPTGTDRNAAGAVLCPQARLVTGCCDPRCLSGDGFRATGVVMGTELVRWRGLRSVPERVVFGAQKNHQRGQTATPQARRSVPRHA